MSNSENRPKSRSEERMQPSSTVLSHHQPRTIAVDEFKWNLTLLLTNFYVDGIPVSKVESEYKRYFGEAPNKMQLCRELEISLMSGDKFWIHLISHASLRGSFFSSTNHVSKVQYIKVSKPRTVMEMKVIAQVASFKALGKVNLNLNHCDAKKVLSSNDDSKSGSSSSSSSPKFSSSVLNPSSCTNSSLSNKSSSRPPLISSKSTKLRKIACRSTEMVSLISFVGSTGLNSLSPLKADTSQISTRESNSISRVHCNPNTMNDDAPCEEIEVKEEEEISKNFKNTEEPENVPIRKIVSDETDPLSDSVILPNEDVSVGSAVQPGLITSDSTLQTNIANRTVKEQSRVIVNHLGEIRVLKYAAVPQKCEFCLEEFLDDGYLTIHYKVCPGKRCACHLCKRVFDSIEQLKHHLVFCLQADALCNQSYINSKAL